MTLVFKQTNGKTLTLEDVNPKSTFGEIKTRLEEQFNIPAARQIIMLAGSSLRDNETPADKGIDKESSIFLIVR